MNRGMNINMKILKHFENLQVVLKQRIISIIVLFVLFVGMGKYNIYDRRVKAQESAEICVENNMQEEMEDDSDIFFGISLKDIINSAIGAFLGFGASLILEQIATSANKRKSINNIVAELESVRDGIRESIISFIPDSIKRDISNGLLTEEFEKENKIVLEILDKKIKEIVYVIYLPIWETVLQTGDILEFKDKPYFDTMIFVYTKIYRLKALIEFYYKGEQNVLELTVILKECLDLDAVFSDPNSSIAELLKN